jgi:hypothetical protein
MWYLHYITMYLLSLGGDGVGHVAVGGLEVAGQGEHVHQRQGTVLVHGWGDNERERKKEAG